MAEAPCERGRLRRVVFIFIGIAFSIGLGPHAYLFDLYLIDYNPSLSEIVALARDEKRLDMLGLTALAGLITGLAFHRIANRAWERLFGPSQRAFESGARRMPGL